MSVATIHASGTNLLSVPAAGAVQENINKPPVNVPRMLERKAAQESSAFHCLPEDVEPLILNHAGDAIFKLGLTCKYWNLRVRGHVNQDPQGKKTLRGVEEAAFFSFHGISAIDAFRETLHASHQIFYEFDNLYMGQECIDELNTSDDPVHLCLPANPNLLSEEFKSALASRRNKLTILDLDAKHGKSVASMIEAINTIPRGGFAALVMDCTDVFSENAAKLWQAISNHPVVVHIEVKGDDALATGDQVVDWLVGLGSKDASVSSFALHGCRIDELSLTTLSKLLTDTTGIEQLEISEAITSAENMAHLTEAVRSRNSRSDSKLTVYMTANNLKQIIDAREGSILANDGIVIREPGQVWVFQREPRQQGQSSVALVQANPADDDSSSVVGDPSSGDENWGSEFDSSDDDSDVVVKNSSDSEG